MSDDTTIPAVEEVPTPATTPETEAPAEEGEESTETEATPAE